MPEIGLGIGKDEYTHQDCDREWLFWYDEKGDRYLTPDEQIEQKDQQITQEKRRSQKLADRLLQLGINPDEL